MTANTISSAATQRPAPLIGLPGRRITGNDVGYGGILGELDLDLYFTDYARAVRAAGGLPVHLPVDDDVEAYAGRLDGILLTGGADVAPSRYDAVAEPATKVEPLRDDIEFALLDLAFAESLPVLGICRGLQVLNVHQGGTLHQHVETHSRYDIAALEAAHKVTFTDGSVMAKMYGAGRATNSLHHQTVDRLAPSLVITGRADDGTVEAVELSDRVIAVQWHPEMMPDRDVDPIFRWLVDAARDRMQEREMQERGTSA